MRILPMTAAATAATAATTDSSPTTMETEVGNIDSTAALDTSMVRIEIDDRPHRSVKELLKNFERPSNQPPKKNFVIAAKPPKRSWRTSPVRHDLRSFDSPDAKLVGIKQRYSLGSHGTSTTMDSSPSFSTASGDTAIGTTPLSVKSLGTPSMEENIDDALMLTESSPGTLDAKPPSETLNMPSAAESPTVLTKSMDTMDMSINIDQSPMMRVTTDAEALTVESLPANKSASENVSVSRPVLARSSAKSPMARGATKPPMARTRVISDKIKQLSVPFNSGPASRKAFYAKPAVMARSESWQSPSPRTKLLPVRSASYNDNEANNVEEKPQVHEATLAKSTRPSRLYKSPSKRGSPEVEQAASITIMTSTDSILENLSHLEPTDQLVMPSCTANAQSRPVESPVRVSPLHSTPLKLMKKTSDPDTVIASNLSSTPDSRISEQSAMHAVKLSPLFLASLRMSPPEEMKREVSPPSSPPRLHRGLSSRHSTPSSINPFAQLSYDIDSPIYERIEDDDEMAAKHASAATHDARDEDENDPENEEGWSSDDSSFTDEERIYHRKARGTEEHKDDAVDHMEMENSSDLADSAGASHFAFSGNPSHRVIANSVPLFPRNPSDEMDNGEDAAAWNLECMSPRVDVISDYSLDQKVRRECSATGSDLSHRSPSRQGGCRGQQYDELSMSMPLPPSPYQENLSDNESISSESDGSLDKISDRVLGDYLAGSDSEDDDSKCIDNYSPPRPPSQFVAGLCSFEGCVSHADGVSNDEQPMTMMMMPMPAALHVETTGTTSRRHKAWFLRRPRLLKKNKSKAVAQAEVVEDVPEPLPIEYGCMSPDSTAATEEEVETVLLER